MGTRSKWAFGAAIVLVSLFIGAIALAVPWLINYQGDLVEKTTDEPLVGTFAMTFRIYDAASAGTMLWEETQSVDVQYGIYSVHLGSDTPLSASIFSSDDRWLEVWVDGEQLLPRQRITSVAFAFTAANAGDADTLDGFDSTGFAPDTPPVHRYHRQCRRCPDP